jgi:hypothetical protein
MRHDRKQKRKVERHQKKYAEIQQRKKMRKGGTLLFAIVEKREKSCNRIQKSGRIKQTDVNLLWLE